MTNIALPDVTRAIPSGRALMLRTQSLRLFAVPVSIAIASCGVSPRHDMKSDEVRPSTYRDIVATYQSEPPACRAIADRAMLDGTFTYDELKRLNDCDAAYADQANQDAKSALRNVIAGSGQ